MDTNTADRIQTTIATCLAVRAEFDHRSDREYVEDMRDAVARLFARAVARGNGTEGLHRDWFVQLDEAAEYLASTDW